VMITSVSLYFHTIMYKAKIEREAEATIEKVIKESTPENLRAEIERLRKENEALASQLLDVKTIGANMSKSVSQTTANTDEDDNMLIIFFTNDSITTTEVTAQTVKAFLERNRQSKGDNMRVTLLSGKDPVAVTESIGRTISFSRLFNVRNLMIEDKIPPENVSVSVATPEKIDDSYHWVKIIVSK